MEKYKEINTDLIEMTKLGAFEVIGHGCNCFCTQESGIAKQMKNNFSTNNPRVYQKEEILQKGYINKLGTVEKNSFIIYNDFNNEKNISLLNPNQLLDLNRNKIPFNIVGVYNMYTQYNYGKAGVFVDYDALKLCMRKLNHLEKGKTIGLPKIGAGLGGGDWNTISCIIQQELIDCYVRICYL